MKLSSKKLAKPSLKIDMDAIKRDFENLDPNDPGAWPLIPRITVMISLFVLGVLAGAWFGWAPQLDELESQKREEGRLKDDWLSRKKKAVNVDAYRTQLSEIERALNALLRQLPNTSEIESLLTDINQAGLGGGLRFQLFRPQPERKKGFYTELPITIKLTGSYNDFGAFASDIAKLSRIVTLNDITISSNTTGLQLDATAKTFRYDEKGG